MSDEKVDADELKKAAGGLEHAEQIERKELRPIFKCECGKTMDIPADVQAKMDNDEDISGDLPACECGKTMTLGVAD